MYKIVNNIKLIKYNFDKSISCVFRHDVDFGPPCTYGKTKNCYVDNCGYIEAVVDGYSTLMRWHHPNGVQLHAS